MRPFLLLLIACSSQLATCKLNIRGGSTSSTSPFFAQQQSSSSSSNSKGGVGGVGGIFQSQSSIPSSIPKRQDEVAGSDDADTKNHERRTVADFLTRYSRTGFIRKVYSIFTVQMATTICVTALIMNNNELAAYLVRNFQAIGIASYVLSTAAVMTLVSMPKLRYKMPWNLLLLGVHTLCQSVMVGVFSSLFDPRSVCLGTLHTLTAFCALTLYSFQPNPKYDLTLAGNLLFTSLIALTLGTFLNFFAKLPLLDNLFSGCLAVLFSVYLAHDTQKIVGGRHHKYSYSQKEYVLAALNIYQDVLSLFIQIMKIIGKPKKR